MTESIVYDPTRRSFQEDPYPLLRELRTNDPLHITAGGIQVVTRHRDVKALLNARVCSGELPMQSRAIAGRLGPTMQAFARAIVHREPPDHPRLRQVFNKPFSQSGVRAFEEVTRTSVNQLLDTTLDRGGATIDFMADVADQLPYLVNFAVLGIPQSMHRQMTHWLHTLERATTTLTDADVIRESDEAICAMREALGGILAAAEPGRAPGLLCSMPNRPSSRFFENGELVDNAAMLVMAGADTVSALLGNVLFLLLAWPDGLARIRDDASLVPAVVNEALRYESPIITAYRWMTDDLEVESGHVSAGRPVYLSLASANRDETVFDDPDTFDPLRADRQQIAFGSGRHLCLGARLARLQAVVVLEVVASRFAQIALCGAPVRRLSTELRTFRTMMVTVTERRRTMDRTE